MSDWGGKRPGAGRPSRAEKRVQIWPTVKITTRQRLNKAAFDAGSAIGEVIDSLVEEKDKKSVDTVRKKK